MSSPFRDAADRFVWSAWGEIGVPSTTRRTFDLAIDLEGLIHLTDVVAVNDPRLLSHVTAWQDAFPEFISRARMKRIGDEAAPRISVKDRSRMMSGAPVVVLSRASAVQLRMRSALGVSARAEIVRQFVLDTPGTRRSSADLAQLCGYTKRNTEKALVSLERGGWIARIEGGTFLRWSLSDHAALATLFAPLPMSNSSFLALGVIVEELLALDRNTSDPVPARSATARGVLANLRPTADWGSIQLPMCLPDSDAWETTLDWVSTLPASAL